MTVTIIGAKSTGFFGKGIRFVERLRYHRDKVNHIAVKVDYPDKTVVYQAEPRKGITNTRTVAEIAPGGVLFYTPLPAGADPAKFIEFLEAQVGEHYGFLSDFSVALDILLPKWAPSVRGSNTWECAAVVAEACRYAGWLHQWGDIYDITPIEFWLAVGGSLIAKPVDRLGSPITFVAESNPQFYDPEQHRP
jgi:hypothetical protein